MFHRWIPFLLLNFVFSFATSALAQTDTEDLRELSIEELLDESVISSTQTYVRLSQAPSNVFVVTGEQIRRYGIRRISELVERLVPGATSSEDVDDMIVSFRGITADNNLKVLLLMNGHEYNTQWNNGSSSEVELGLMDDIKKVEVLIGPHSALYGSGALIGVINIITRNGRDFSDVRISGNYGSGQFRRGEIIIGKEVNDHLNYFVSAGGLAADGYDNNNNGQLNISRFPATWRLFANVNFKEFQIQSRYTRSARALYVFPTLETRPDRWTNYDTVFLDGRHSFRSGDNLRLDLNLSYDSIQTQRHDFRTGVKFRAVGEDRYTAKLSGFYTGWNRQNLVIAASYRRDEFGSDWEGDNFNFNPVIQDGVVTNVPVDFYAFRSFTPYGRNVYAFYGQDSIVLSDQTSLLLGFRYDRIEAPQIREPNLFSPRLAVVYTPNTKTVLKAMITSGVSRIINAAVTSPDPILLGSPTVLDVDKPEKMHSFEVAASYRPNPSLDLSVNVFYNSLRDILGADPTRPPGNPPTPEQPFFLISGGRIDFIGFEAVASANPTERTFFRVLHQHVQLGPVVKDPFGFLTTQDREHANNYPEDLTKLVVENRLHKNLSMNVNSNLVWNHHWFIRNPSDPQGTLTVDTGFYALMNANLVWNLNLETELIFSGYNLLNSRKHVSPLHFGVPGSRVYLAERNFNISLSYRF